MGGLRSSHRFGDIMEFVFLVLVVVTTLSLYTQNRLCIDYDVFPDMYGDLLDSMCSDKPLTNEETDEISTIETNLHHAFIGIMMIGIIGDLLSIGLMFVEVEMMWMYAISIASHIIVLLNRNLFVEKLADIELFLLDQRDITS